MGLFDRKSTGYSEVPYRGMKEPEDRHRAPHYRKLSRKDKRANALTMGAFGFITLIPLAIGYYYILKQNSIAIFICVLFLIFMLVVDAMMISAIRRKR